jgi:hypothetical protein
LFLLTFVNSAAVLSLLITLIPSRQPDAPSFWNTLTLAQRYLFFANVTIAVANLVFLVALFRWKQWGFLGFVGTNILSVVIAQTFGKPGGRAFIPLLMVVILYGALHVGEEKNGWTQLE